MVVTAGQQDRRDLLAEPFLAGNLTGMAAGLVKWALEVHRSADLGPVLRRAFHDAASPPTGPVFVSVPMDVLQDRGAFAVPAPSRIERRAVPAALPELASAILAAPRARFAVVAGDEVTHSGATSALVAVAERLGCRVYGPAMHSTGAFPTAHPLWAGALPADTDQVHAEQVPRVRQPLEDLRRDGARRGQLRERREHDACRTEAVDGATVRLMIDDMPFEPQ
jgi:benzoylformate decarboxylase